MEILMIRIEETILRRFNLLCHSLTPLLVLTIASTSVRAQTSGLVEIPDLPDATSPSLSQASESLPDSQNPDPEQLTPSFSSDIPDYITVRRFQVTGSTVFSEAELEKVTKDFIGEEISFAQLLQAADAVTQLYVEHGYITSAAFIPPQGIEGDVVVIQVLEGSVEQINVKGNKRLRASYVQSRLERGAATPLQVNRLVEALQLLQQNPLIAQISSELSAGTEPGQSIVDLEIKEAPSFSAYLGVDNSEAPSIGTVGLNVGFQEANLLGFGDALAVDYIHTEGSDQLDNVSYTLPVNSLNGSLKFAYRWYDNEVVQSPFDVLNLQSNSRNYSLTFRQPIVQTTTTELALGLEFMRREGDTRLLDVPFPISPGANEKGQTRLSILSFFQEWLNRNSQEVIALRSEFSFGLDVLGATVSDSAAGLQGQANGQFFLWRGQGQYLRLMAPDTILLLRADIQLTPDPLVPFEQYGIGGINNVRGYSQNFLNTDNAVFVSAEARFPLARIPAWNSVLQLGPFFDLGTGWNNDPQPNPSEKTLSSVGLALVWQMGDYFSARVDWGIPLVQLDIEKDSLQENGLYFSIKYKL
jgi:hemolysin activation/secretion protein